MATKSQVAKQLRRKKLVDLKWDRRQELKKIILSPATSQEDKQKAVLQLNKLPKNSSRVRLRNRCQMTGRCRGYLQKFQLSRLCFRELASKGMIPGIVKASW